MKTKPKEKVFINLDSLQFHLNASKELEEYEKEMINDIPHFEVIYERDLQDNSKHNNLIKGISTFLGVQEFQSNTKLKRVTPKSYSDFIHNSEELTQFLINNGYKQYIDYWPSK